MTYYPLFLDLKDRPVLVVGAGEVAAGKVLSLLRVGARLRVVAPEAVSWIAKAAAKGCLEWCRRPFEDGDIEGRVIIIAGTSDEDLNRRIAVLAREAGRLVNVVDDPGWCDFIVPSIARRGPMQVAVSSGGKSPTLARRLRLEIEQLLRREGLGELASFLGEQRSRVRVRDWSYERKKAFWAAVVDSEIAALVRAGKWNEAREGFERELSAWSEEKAWS